MRLLTRRLLQSALLLPLCLSAATSEEVAPGVWRVRIGEPERFTPCAIREGQQQRGGPAEAQRVVADDRADRLRQREGEQSVSDAARPRVRETMQVDLKARKKHDVEQPDAAEERDGVTAREEVETVRAHHDPREKQEHQIRHAQALRQ